MELMVVMVLGMFMVPMLVPVGAKTLTRHRVRAAGRDAAALFRRCRTHASLSNRHVAVRFRACEQEEGWCYSVYRDGDGDGVRNNDIDNHRDPMVRPPEPFAPRFHGIPPAIFPRENIPRVPKARGTLEGTNPIRFGNSFLVSFSPTGQCSSGTLYLSDGHHAMAAVKLYGPTGRLQQWEYDPTGNVWKRLDAFR